MIPGPGSLVWALASLDQVAATKKALLFKGSGVSSQLLESAKSQPPHPSSLCTARTQSPLHYGSNIPRKWQRDILTNCDSPFIALTAMNERLHPVPKMVPAQGEEQHPSYPINSNHQGTRFQLHCGTNAFALHDARGPYSRNDLLRAQSLGSSNWQPAHTLWPSNDVLVKSVA